MSNPIEGLMKTAMENLKEMVDVNTIVGEAVQSPEGTVVIPVSKVTFGFASGGGEYNSKSKVQGKDDADEKSQFPFAGGSGGGVSITPMAFLVVGPNQVKLLPVNINTSFEKLTDFLPTFIEKIGTVLGKNKEKGSEKKDREASVSEKSKNIENEPLY